MKWIDIEVNRKTDDYNITLFFFRFHHDHHDDHWEYILHLKMNRNKKKEN